MVVDPTVPPDWVKVVDEPKPTPPPVVEISKSVGAVMAMSVVRSLPATL
jgi:hypothetical protein